MLLDLNKNLLDQKYKSHKMYSKFKEFAKLKPTLKEPEGKKFNQQGQNK
jgi:hypothetical protein